MLKRLMEIQRRKMQLRDDVEKLTGKELDDAIKEVEELEKEKEELEKQIKESGDEEKSGKRNFQSLGFYNTEKRSLGIDSSEYRSAFLKSFAGVELTDIEKRAMTTNASSAGAAVPVTTMNKILEKIENRSILYNLVSVSHLKGNVIIPVEGTTNSVQRKAEGQEGTIQDDTLSKIQLGAKKYIKLVQLTCELEATAIDALENYIVDKLAKKFAQAFDEDIANGDGTNGAKGILQIITPIDTENADTLTYDDICTLFAALPANAKINANLIASTNTLYNRIAKVKDDVKRPIFDVEHQKVLGRTVLECDSIPDDIIVFGDLETYMFNWNKDLEITKSKEAAFKSGDTVFRGLALIDGNMADLGAIKALKIKTV